MVQATDDLRALAIPLTGPGSIGKLSQQSKDANRNP
jgi:hypothetical protein